MNVWVCYVVIVMMVRVHEITIVRAGVSALTAVENGGTKKKHSQVLAVGILIAQLAARDDEDEMKIESPAAIIYDYNITAGPFASRRRRRAGRLQKGTALGTRYRSHGVIMTREEKRCERDTYGEAKSNSTSEHQLTDTTGFAVYARYIASCVHYTQCPTRLSEWPRCLLC